MASIAKVTASKSNKSAIAKSAGLTGTETAVPADKFKLVTSQEAAGFSAGDTISTKKQAVLYFRALLNEDMEEGKETALSDNQIWECIKQFEQGDLEPVDVDQGILNYLNDLTSSIDKPLTSDQERALSENELWSAAVLDGQSATPELEAKLDETIEGKKIWDGGPIVLEAQLVKDYGPDKMKRWPPIGTRLTGKTNKKGQSTDVLPHQGYNGNTDYFKVELPGNDPVIKRWLQGFVENMPHVAPLIVERKTVKALLDNNTLAIVPKKYAPFVPTKDNGVLQVNGPKLQGFYDDLTGEITKRVNRIGQAILFWQAKQQLAEHLPNIRYELVDETPEATAKRSRPIQMFSIVNDPQDKTLKLKQPEPKPIALSRFIKHGKNARSCSLQKGGMALLNKMATNKKPPTPPATTGSATQATSYKIENVDAMSSSLANLYDYIKHHEPMIKDKIRDTATGEEFCSWLMSAYKALEGIIEGNEATFELIQTRAKAYDQTQTAAVNAAFKKAEAAKGKAAA